eukprot:CAMPEP_0170131630 /NCGR_PEP_ID=MMETSP0020_2-20130122/23379_1 /TAXON_ID=98059 /ORGANISM="Dinobryon sp., Strain UTEXLB2267" /LENGTH=1216 /DNA_ID=CAMNT_0010366775 /DNA_START=1200 /DNA_END=4847 /DNA_ORIENTATION=+
MNNEDERAHSPNIAFEYVEIYRENSEEFQLNDELECGSEFSLNSILLVGESLYSSVNSGDEIFENNCTTIDEENEVFPKSTGFVDDNQDNNNFSQSELSKENTRRRNVVIYRELDDGTLEEIHREVQASTGDSTDRIQVMNMEESSCSEEFTDEKIESYDESRTISIPVEIDGIKDIQPDHLEVTSIKCQDQPEGSLETEESSIPLGDITNCIAEKSDQISSTSLGTSSNKITPSPVNLYLWISVTVALVFVATIWVMYLKLQTAPRYFFIEVESGLFTYHKCDSNQNCSTPRLLAMTVKEVSLQPVPLIQPIPLAVQARRALALMAEDVSCVGQITCHLKKLHKRSKVIIHGTKEDSAVLKWHIQAELNSIDFELLPPISNNRTIQSLLDGYGFNKIGDDDLFEEMQFKWSNVHNILNQLQNNAVVDVHKLKEFEDNQRSVCTEASRKTTLAVIGKAKAGKSTFLNALLGRSVMPVNSDICTATITLLEYPSHGEQEHFIVFYKSAHDTEIHLNATIARVSRFEKDCIRAGLELEREMISAEEKAYICNAFEHESYLLHKTESAIAYVNELLERQETVDDLKRFVQFADGRDDNILPILVDRIRLFIRSDILQHISLVDTPGLGDSNAARNSASQRALSFVDGYIYLVSAQEMAPADVRKELNWIRDMAGDIPHIKMLSRVDEFTGWRRDARKRGQKKNVESALIERRREYDALDIGSRGIPTPWNNALGVEIINKIIATKESLTTTNMETLFDFLKGSAGLDHLTNILISDYAQELNLLSGVKESFRQSVLRSESLIHQPYSQNCQNRCSKTLKHEQCTIQCIQNSESLIAESLNVIRLIIMDSSGIVQSVLALKQFIHDMRTNSVISSCEKQYNQLFQRRFEDLSTQASRLKVSISKILRITNSTFVKELQAENGDHPWSSLSADDMQASLDAEKEVCRMKRDKLIQWKDFISHYDLDVMVHDDIIQQVNEKWNAFEVDNALLSKAYNSISTELISDNYQSIDFTYCGYLNCSASVNLYHIFDSPYVQRYIKLLRATSNRRFEEFHLELKTMSASIGVGSITEFASIQVPDLSMGTITGSMLGVQGTSTASPTWEHQSLYFRWECNAKYCTPANNESLPSVLLKSVELELEERNRYYSQQFQKVAAAFVTLSVVRAMDAFLSEINYQLQNIELQIANWEGSNIDSLYKQYTLLEADTYLLQNSSMIHKIRTLT